MGRKWTYQNSNTSRWKPQMHFRSRFQSYTCHVFSTSFSIRSNYRFVWPFFLTICTTYMNSKNTIRTPVFELFIPSRSKQQLKSSNLYGWKISTRSSPSFWLENFIIIWITYGTCVVRPILVILWTKDHWPWRFFIIAIDPNLNHKWDVNGLIKF